MNTLLLDGMAPKALPQSELKRSAIAMDPALASILREVRGYLETRNVANIKVHQNSIVLHPHRNGFPIHVEAIERGRLLLDLGGFYEDDYSTADILRLIRSALAGQIRIRSTFLNGKPWKFAMLSQDDNGSWIEVSQIAYIRLALMKKIVTHSLRQY